MSRSHPKPPILHRISPPERRRVLQGRITQFIPHYFFATDYHTHHALELCERFQDLYEDLSLLDSDERIIGWLYGRAEWKYGEPVTAPLPDWFNAANKEGYDLFYKLGDA